MYEGYHSTSSITTGSKNGAGNFPKEPPKESAQSITTDKVNAEYNSTVKKREADPTLDKQK